MKSIFGSLVAELWDASAAESVGLVGGDVDTWTGLERGIVLAAAAEANRCTYTAANALFNGKATVTGDRTGANSLAATGISPALVTTAGDPYVLMVGRSTADFAAGSNNILFALGSATSQYTVTLYLPSSGALRRRVVRTGSSNSDISHTTDPTVAALWRAWHQGSDTTAGSGFIHNASSTAVSGASVSIVADIDRIGFSAHSAAGDRGSFEAAEIVVLSGRPTTEQLDAYAAHVTTEYGL